MFEYYSNWYVNYLASSEEKNDVTQRGTKKITSAIGKMKIIGHF